MFPRAGEFGLLSHLSSFRFMNEEAEAQRASLTCPPSPGGKAVQLGVHPTACSGAFFSQLFTPFPSGNLLFFSNQGREGRLVKA